LPGLPILAAALIAALVLAGALIWFRPYLTHKQQPVAEVPAPAALFAVSEFSVPPRGQACMSSVTMVPAVRVAEFHLRPSKPTPRGGPPVDLVLSAPGYRAVLSVPGGYPGGSVALPIAPPRRAEIGTACFINRGATTVLLDGTTEPRTVSRSGVQIDGRSVVGDIALTFLEGRPSSLLDRLGEVFSHASNLTDRLVPVWLIWMLALLVAFGVPIATITAFWRSLREDETTGRL
jgi:hypothetical protein